MSDEIMVLADKHDTKIFSQKATLTRLRSTADRGASGGAVSLLPERREKNPEDCAI